MTLEERMGKLERHGDEVRDIGLEMAKGGLELTERVVKLEEQLAELDVMVISIHQTLKDIQEGL